MGSESTKKVDFQGLAEALRSYHVAYLVTVDYEYRIHTVGGRTRDNVASHRAVTLLWPPSDPGGYSLIVDGRAEILAAPEATSLRVTPTRALLHRNADPDDDGLHDCVMLHQP